MKPSVRQWLAVTTVAAGIFALVTTELMPVALLTPVASELHVSAGTAGMMVTIPGIVAGFAAVLTPAVTGRLDRRIVLCGLMGLLAAANLICAVAPTFGVLLSGRLLVGLSIGGFWAIAGGLAMRLVPERSVGVATSIIFGGVATASVIGVPAGALIGELADWRAVFAVMAVASVAVFAALLVVLPSLPPQDATRPRQLPRLVRKRDVRAGLLATMLLVTGQFTAFTYVRPVLEQVAGLEPALIGTMLLLYGIAGIAGNFLAGLAAARDVRRALLAISATLPAAMLLLPVLGHDVAGATILLIAWGLAYGGVSVSLQTWMLKSAPNAPEAGTALFVSTFNVSISLGALLGGIAADALAAQSVMWLGATLVAFTAATIGLRDHRLPQWRA